MEKKNNYLVNVNTTIKVWVSATDENEAMELARNHMLLLSVGVTPGVKKVEATGMNVNAIECGIMEKTDRLNGHLVEYINYAYGRHTTRFIEIMKVLTTRDKEELYRIDVNIRTTPTEELIREYLMNIATNDDLKTILLFCKVEF